MSLRFADSFERYKLGLTSDSQVLGGISAYWTSVAFATCGIVQKGRNGSKCAQIGAGAHWFKTLTHERGWSVAWAYQVNPGINGTLQNVMLSERNNDTEVIRVEVNADGTTSVTVGSSFFTFVVGTQLHYNKYYHFELQYDLEGDAGEVFIIHDTFKLIVDGDVTVLNPGVDVDTGLSSLNFINKLATTNVHMILSSQASNYLDDFVIFDHLNGVNDGTIGDVKILGIVPNGDTAVKDFTPSTGTTHFNLINFIPPTGDASSLFSPNVGDKDIWDWQNIPSFTGTIPGVHISIYARKDDEGSRAFQIVTGASGSENQSPDFWLNDDYVYHHHSLDVDPNGDIPWTVTNFNAKKFGAEVTQ